MFPQRGSLCAAGSGGQVEHKRALPSHLDPPDRLADRRTAGCVQRRKQSSLNRHEKAKMTNVKLDYTFVYFLRLF